MQGGVLLSLLVLCGVAFAGPSGLIAWNDSQRRFEQRQIELAQLALERDRLRNRVELLNPKHTDPDLAGQLLRSHLNVAHPDEMVMLLD